MATLQFNRVHKNGWVSFKQVGTPGAVYVDKRMLSEVPGPGSSIELEIAGLLPPGADATQLSVEKAAKKLANDQAKADRAAKAEERANARLAKGEEAIAKLQPVTA